MLDNCPNPFNSLDLTHSHLNYCSPAILIYPQDGPFAWSEPLQGTILSCYFWGYFFSQIPGARVAELMSAKWVMFFSVAINVVCTLLTPVMAKLHYGAMIAMRIGQVGD